MGYPYLSVSDETSYESTKGGFSAASKRAAVTWGIGRYLYELPETHVELKSSRFPGCQYGKVKINNKEISGYWASPKVADVKKGTSNQPANSQPNGDTETTFSKNSVNGRPQAGKRENNSITLNHLSDQVVKAHKILKLSNAEQVNWFNRVNPGGSVSDIKGILASDEVSLIRYNDILKHAASIKFICQKENISQEHVFRYLSNKLGENISDFKQIIYKASHELFKEIENMILSKKNQTA